MGCPMSLDGATGAHDRLGRWGRREGGYSYLPISLSVKLFCCDQIFSVFHSFDSRSMVKSICFVVLHSNVHIQVQHPSITGAFSTVYIA